jgi:hypothetical protein
MAGTEHTDDDHDPNRASTTAATTADAERRTTEGDRRGFDGAAEWIAASTLRLALALVGMVILLFGLGMAVGVDFLVMAADVLNSVLGRWLLVALVGLVILFVAMRGFTDTTD